MAQGGGQEQPPGTWGSCSLRADLYIYLQEDESWAWPGKPCPLTGGDEPEAPSSAAARGPVLPPVSPQGFSSRQRAQAALEQTHSPAMGGLGHGKSQNWGQADPSIPSYSRHGWKLQNLGSPKGLKQRKGDEGRGAGAEPASPSLAGPREPPHTAGGAGGRGSSCALVVGPERCSQERGPAAVH